MERKWRSSLRFCFSIWLQKDILFFFSTNVCWRYHKIRILKIKLSIMIVIKNIILAMFVKFISFISRDRIRVYHWSNPFSRPWQITSQFYILMKLIDNLKFVMIFPLTPAWIAFILLSITILQILAIELKVRKLIFIFFLDFFNFFFAYMTP